MTDNWRNGKEMRKKGINCVIFKFIYIKMGRNSRKIIVRLYKGENENYNTATEYKKCLHKKVHKVYK